MSGQVGENVNGPLGEAYSAYWDHWLNQAAARAATRFSSGISLDVSQSPIEVFERVANRFGTGEIFHLSRSMPHSSGFEAVKQVLERANNPADLARRWQTIAQQQANVRLGHKTSTGQLVSEVAPGEFLLDPASQRQAKLTQFGPAMLSGAAASAFQHVASTKLELIEIRPSGASRPMYDKDGRANDFDADSKLLIRQTAVELSGQTFSELRVPTLSHLSDAQHIPFLRRLSNIMINDDGTHTPMSKAAHAMGLSTRTLSRRLTESGLSYAKLMRFLRLRHASQLLAVPNISLDEIAFRATYADRHHMARNFRRMTELSPSDFRDLMR